MALPLSLASVLPTKDKMVVPACLLSARYAYHASLYKSQRAAVTAVEGNVAWHKSTNWEAGTQVLCAGKKCIYLSKGERHGSRRPWNPVIFMDTDKKGSTSESTDLKMFLYVFKHKSAQRQPTTYVIRSTKEKIVIQEMLWLRVCNLMMSIPWNIVWAILLACCQRTFLH